VIADTGGFRKARWARRGKGKSGGYRVIYFYSAPPGTVYLALMYPKSRQASLSAADKNVLARIAAQIKREVRGR